MFDAVLCPYGFACKFGITDYEIAPSKGLTSVIPLTSIKSGAKKTTTFSLRFDNKIINVMTNSNRRYSPDMTGTIVGL
jgi:hypothetical protein